MAVDPLRMLERLEAEQQAQTPVEPVQQTQQTGLQNPEEMLNRLETELDVESQSAGEKNKNPEKSFMQLLQNDLMMGDQEHAALVAESDETDRGSGLALAKGFVKSGQGTKQFSLGLAEDMGFVPEGTTKAYENKTESERKLFADEFNKEFGDKAQFKIAEVAGQLAPMMVVGSLAPAAATFKGATAIGAGTGAVAGASLYVPKDAEEGRLWNTIENAGWGALTAGLFNIFPGIRNKIRDMIGKSARTKQVDRALAVAKRTGTDLKLTQLTDDPVAIQLENIALGTVKGERAALGLSKKQIQQNLNYWNKVTSSFSKTGKNFGGRMKAAFDKTLGDTASGTGLLGARAKQAKVDYAAVDRAAGGQKSIPLTNFITKVQKLKNEAGLSASKEKKKFVKEMVDIAKSYRQGKVSGKQMQDLMETYGKASKGRGRLWAKLDGDTERDFSKALFSELNKDLKAAANSGKPGAAELKIARTNYKANSEAIKALEKSALKTLFKSGDESAGELEKAFSKMSAEKIKGVMGILQKSDPDLQGGLQRFWLKNALAKASETRDFTSSMFDPKNMLDLLKGTNKDVFKAVFNDTAKRRLVIDGLRMAQRVIVRNSTVSAKGEQFIKGLAGVAASMDRTFVARLTAEVFTPKAISGYVGSKEGVQLLKTLATTHNVNAGAAALIGLNNIRKENKKEANGN